MARGGAHAAGPSVNPAVAGRSRSYPDGVRAEAKQAAREAETSTTFRRLARAGYAANGIVHGLVGVIVLVLAFGGDGEADQAGAFKAISTAPVGFAALWALAIALWALAAWHIAEGLLAPGSYADAEAAARKWGLRLSAWGQAAVFAALGVVAASVALGARPDGEEAAEDASRGILSIPGGPFLLGAIGLGIFAVGVAFVVMGVLRSFEKKLDLPDTAVGSAVTALGVVGYVAKGIALVLVGAILVIAAVRVDPDAAGGLDGAVTAILALPVGPALAGLVGVGFLAYGVFCIFRARYARL